MSNRSARGEIGYRLAIRQKAHVSFAIAICSPCLSRSLACLRANVKKFQAIRGFAPTSLAPIPGGDRERHRASANSPNCKMHCETTRRYPLPLRITRNARHSAMARGREAPKVRRTSSENANNPDTSSRARAPMDFANCEFAG